ncbi:MAG: hypothetical protein CXT67_09705 [Methanobacteriota archaeon]|nr:MAG: hypothetical protein CXT67_09705 [Euryarchaeota archaeon]
MHEALTKLIIETEIERATAKAVLIILSKFTNIECECFPSISTITQLSSMSRSTTIRSLNWLDQAGYISRVKKHRQPTRYKIEMDTLMDRNNKPLKIKSESPLGVTVTPQDKRVVSLSN